jgi:HK97 family phage major capsid protein
MDAELRKTGGFKSQGEFFVAARKYFSGVMNPHIDELRKAALNESTDSQGGVLVPEEWAKPIFNAALEGSLVRSRAIVLPMQSDTLRINTLVDSDRSSNVFGGVTLTWLDEEADEYATTVKPAIGQITLTAHKALATVFVANELEQDYDALGAFLTRSFGDAVRFYEDDKFLWGTGSGQPLGIMYSGALATVARTSNAAVAGSGDAGKMAALLLPGCWRNAVWLVNQSMLSTWAGNVTTSGANALGPIDLGDMKILGRPVIVTEHALAPGGIGDFILADFSHYVIGDRSLIISASRHATYSSSSYGWFQDQTCWKMQIRVAGQPILPATVTPLRGGTALSPFVALTTAS